MRGIPQVLIANKYLPGKRNSLTLHKIEKNKWSSMEESLDEASNDEDQTVYSGLTNRWSKNQAYKNLITEEGVDHLSSDDIFV